MDLVTRRAIDAARVLAHHRAFCSSSDTVVQGEQLLDELARRHLRAHDVCVVAVLRYDGIVFRREPTGHVRFEHGVGHAIADIGEIILDGSDCGNVVAERVVMMVGGEGGGGGQFGSAELVD